MAETIKVDLEALQTVSNSLTSIKRSVENVVDTLPSIKRMSVDAWPGDDSVADIFEENCHKLRGRCIELMQSMDKRSKNLNQAIANYRGTDKKAVVETQRLPGGSIFN